MNKEKRIIETVKEFLAHGGEISDKELAVVLNNNGIKTSSSTVGRDLTDGYEGLKNSYNHSTIDCQYISQEIASFIKNKRSEALLKAKIKGGITSSINNTVVRDKDGKFIGCRK